MTPTASRLRVRLDDRRQWFTNEWFFKWHFIGKDGPVSIESFDGRGIHLSGIAFSGSARAVYWDTIVKGVRKEVDEQLAWIDDHIRSYNHETAMEALDECAGQLISFVNSIRREAISKDRILRGDGVNFPPEQDGGRWDTVSERSIISQTNALKAALPIAFSTLESDTLVSSLSKRELATNLWQNNQWWLGPIGLLVGLAGLLLLIL
ncbi:hypothetical protein JQK15_14295 [Sphingobium sp. BHU LFT2]|uniref:hypothetical protein n=1 Tax=Sphingobium sp. BHU LFT2 TaxID=2807634 RepID=UPI001BE533C9|nr:hypothetical protein [Sphingobium sp. BHU LFT2]MBT2244712.1 hypothetical protein [Sphingobium sp. BHU LFT2]